MSQATFLYVCNELQSTIERADTEMRKAIPVEQRVALTFSFSLPMQTIALSVICLAFLSLLFVW